MSPRKKKKHCHRFHWRWVVCISQKISSLTFAKCPLARYFYQSLVHVTIASFDSFYINFITHWHTRTNSLQTTIFPFLFVIFFFTSSFFFSSSFANCLVLLIALKSSKTWKILSVSFFLVCEISFFISYCCRSFSWKSFDINDV